MNIELDQIIKELTSWIEQNGGFVNKNLFLKMEEVESRKERTIYCKEKIQKNQKILEIPHELRINNHHFEKIPGIENWKKRDEHQIFEKGDVKCWLSLIYEKSLGQKSFFYPYLQSLPDLESFSEHPLCIFPQNKEPIQKKNISFFLEDHQRKTKRH